MKSIAMNLWIAAALLAPGALSAQEPFRLEGSVWIFRAIIYPATTPAYQGTALFREDGTIGGLPRDGHGSATIAGVWDRAGLSYAFTFAADTYDSSGNFLSTSVVTGVFRVGNDGVSASGTSLVEVLDIAGNVIFKQPAAQPTPFTGQRIVAGTLPVQ